jgi:large subunit ribosomal protein L17
MRHRSKKITIDRNARQRRPLLRNLCINLIMHGRIVTTPVRARAAKALAEKMVTAGKTKSLTGRRKIIKTLNSPAAAEQVMKVLGPRFESRAGGYTRLVKLSPRHGDGAEQVVVEFIE